MRRHGLHAWEGSDDPHRVNEKGIIKGEKVPMLIRSARMRRTYGADFVSARCATQWRASISALACLLASKERKGKEKGARVRL